MFLEVKSLLTGVAIVMISFVMISIIFINMLLGFVLLMSIGLMFMGDMLIGYLITKNHLKWLIDPLGPNQELCVLFDHSGNMDFIRTHKQAFDTRSFTRYKKQATIINTGSFPIRTHNGNKGFVGHEDFDRNVDLLECEVLDKLPGDTIKDIYEGLPHEQLKKKDGVV